MTMSPPELPATVLFRSTVSGELRICRSKALGRSGDPGSVRRNLLVQQAVREVPRIQIRVAPCHPPILPGHPPSGRPIVLEGSYFLCFFLLEPLFFFLLLAAETSLCR